MALQNYYLRVNLIFNRIIIIVKFQNVRTQRLDLRSSVKTRYWIIKIIQFLIFLL